MILRSNPVCAQILRRQPPVVPVRPQLAILAEDLRPITTMPLSRR